MNVTLGVVPNWLIGVGLLALAILAGIQMYRGDALVCADGAIFAEKCALYPRGAVIAFDRDDLDKENCPRGWEPFKESGRVIVGVGDPPYEFRNRGGVAEHKLTLDEMPAHEHPVSPYDWGLQVNGGEPPWTRRVDVDDGPPYKHEGKSITGRLVATSMGEGKAHNNMPPYIALYLCKKK